MSHVQHFYIANVGSSVLLGTDGESKVLGYNVRNGPPSDYLQWQVVLLSSPPTSNEGTVLLLNASNNTWLAPGESGNQLQMRRLTQEEQAMLAQGDVPDGLRWKLVICPHQEHTFYLVSADGRFLDCHGDSCSLWKGSTGHESQQSPWEIVRRNTSRHASNIRWALFPAATFARRVAASVVPGCLPASHLTRNQPAVEPVVLLHLSDTHSMHRTIEVKYPLPPADILLHTGDFSNHGTDEEIKDFNEWLGELKQSKRFRHIIVIPGNHDIRTLRERFFAGEISRDEALDGTFWAQRLSNALTLHHELVEVKGLRIFGSAFDAHMRSEEPGDKPCKDQWLGGAHGPPPQHRYASIPSGVDVLMTHGPAAGIFDSTMSGSSWGSSTKLREAIQNTRPRVHLFGHLHEQRGVWVKSEDGYVGGVEYQPYPDNRPGMNLRNDPPPPEYPVQLISNNAMQNHPGEKKVGRPPQIAAGGRVIVATRAPNKGPWQFSTSAQGHRENAIPPRPHPRPP